MSAGEGEGEEDRDELTQCSTVQEPCPVCSLVLGPSLLALCVSFVSGEERRSSLARVMTAKLPVIRNLKNTRISVSPARHQESSGVQ